MSLVALPAAVPGQVANARELFVDAIDNMLPERDAVIDEYARLVDTFNDRFNWLQRNIFNRAAYAAMRDMVEQIGEHLETVVVDGIGTIIDVANHVVQHHTPVLSLFVTSIRWVDDSMTPLSEVESRVAPGAENRELSQAEWDDSARASYDSIVSEQQDATEAAKELAKVMSRWLSELADENVGYVTFLLQQLATLAGRLAEAVTAVATSAGVFTLEAIAEYVGDIVRGAIETLAEIGDRMASAINRIIGAENELADHAKFPNGDWPIAVARP